MKKILIVDNMASRRNILAEVLGANKIYHILEADGNLAGLSLIQSEKPDLILLDAMLTNYPNNFELYRQFKSCTGAQHIPKVIMIMEPGHYHFTELESLYVDDYLIKPLHLRSLMEKVDRALVDETQTVLN